MNDVTNIFETSTDIGEIAKVLPKAQAAMGDVFKTAVNPAFRSKYANLANVVEAVVPALNANGITLLQPMSFDGDFVNVATMLLHESGQWVRCTVGVAPGKKDAQGIGSATTYLRRYGLMAMSGVAPEDDDGNAASANQKKQEPQSSVKKEKTLAERADEFEARVKAAKDQVELSRIAKLGEGLLKDLEKSDPERGVEVFELIKRLDVEFGEEGNAND